MRAHFRYVSPIGCRSVRPDRRLQEAAVTRIVFVIPTLDQSGAERQLTLLACGLVRRGFDVQVVALNRGGYYRKVLENAGIPVFVTGKRFRMDVLTWWRLRRLLHRLQPDIVQSLIFAASSFVRLPGVCPPGTPIIVSERCVDTWKSGWQKSIDRRLARRMTVMTANSQSVADFYRDEIGISAERLRVIPNGVPEPPGAPGGTLHRELGLPENTRIIGFIGRLAAQKNLKDLVWGFHLIRQAAPEPVALVLIGDGPERDRLADFLTDLGTRHLVHFLGHRSDAASLLADFSVFCLPSAFEGMSNSLMEAMIAGIPCVVSDIPANRELIQHEETGLTYPVGKAPQMAQAVLRLLNDAQECQRLSRNAQRLIRTEYSVDMLVRRHIALYEEILSQNGVPQASRTAQQTTGPAAGSRN